MLVSGRVTNNISQGMSKDFDSVCMSSWPRLQMWSCPSPSSLQDFIEKIQAEPKGRARDSYVSGCLRIADVLRRPMFIAFPLGKQHSLKTRVLGNVTQFVILNLRCSPWIFLKTCKTAYVAGGSPPFIFLLPTRLRVAKPCDLAFVKWWRLVCGILTLISNNIE